MPNDGKTTYGYVETARVLAAFAVVLLHVSTSVVQDCRPVSPVNWWIGNLVDSAARWCVPVFVMVSGALLLDPSKNEPLLEFFRKRFKRILLPVVFWTVVYLPLRSASGGITLKYVVWCIATGSVFYHLWYIYMIPGLYLFTPFLRVYVRHSSSAERTWLIILIFVTAAAYSVADRIFLDNQRSIFSMFVPFMGYYLCGYQLRDGWPSGILKKHLVAVIAFCVLLTAAATHLLTRELRVGWGGLFYDNFSPTNIVLSVAIFMLVLRCCGASGVSKGPLAKMVGRIGPTTLGIYLLHPALIELTRKLTARPEINSLAAVVIPATTVGVFVMCYYVIAVVQRIPLLRRTVG